MKKALIENAKKDENGNGERRAELTKALQEERAARQQKCGDEFQKLLRKYDCALVLRPVIKEGGVLGAEASILAK